MLFCDTSWWNLLNKILTMSFYISMAKIHICYVIFNYRGTVKVRETENGNTKEHFYYGIQSQPVLPGMQLLYFIENNWIKMIIIIMISSFCNFRLVNPLGSLGAVVC